MLVSRLDGHTVADVRGSIDRAQNIVVPTASASILFDESNANGTADLSANGELDNSASAFSLLRANDDYETARGLLTTDRRFINVRYDAAANAGSFFVGPLRSFQAGQGILVGAANPVFLLATYGANHAPEFVGVPFYADGSSAYGSYASSYGLAPGAIFNTIESFNARDLGGLGQLNFAVQEQVANWIAYGGTFALGNCWEPLADSIPDNASLVQNFVLGNLTWGEAAWTSIPSLSWMQLVIGDPLARIVRSTEDVNGDLRLDVDDLEAWDEAPTDVNRDGTANAADRQLLVRTLRAWERGDLLNRRR
jgi:hypothetical protein